MSDFWKSKQVCVLGGAGFIGSHLANSLSNLARSVVVADNFSSGHNNIPNVGLIYPVDLRDFNMCAIAIKDCDVVFHLASDVGGRAYMTNNKQKMWGNLELDVAILRACAVNNASKVVFFSSACVYPTGGGRFCETSPSDIEKADGVYGMEKLIGEHMTRDFSDNKFDYVSVRPFTVYGQGMREGRAIGALIAKTFIEQDPFEVWGDGNQIVDWVYVKDLVDGVLLATEKVSGEAVNIGSEHAHTPMDALEIIWDYVGWRPKKVIFKTDMPTSPPRVADTSKLRSLGWNTNFTLEQGLRDTIIWYYKTHSVEDVRKNLERILVEK